MKASITLWWFFAMDFFPVMSLNPAMSNMNDLFDRLVGALLRDEIASGIAPTPENWNPDLVIDAFADPDAIDALLPDEYSALEMRLAGFLEASASD
jgi:hypothetical protein